MTDPVARLELSDDNLLLSRVVQKDRRAFELLYRRYYRRVFHFVVKIVRQDAAAEEVVSDVMFAVWQGAGSFTGASSVSTWLLGIAYRQAMKLIEKGRKHARVDSNDELIAEAVDGDPATDPERTAITDSETALLQKAVEALPEHQRVVVELTATGHSYGEIALIVGCPENTVKTRMFHARLQLKRYLERAEREAPRVAGVAAIGVAVDNSTEAIPFHGASTRPGHRI